jgi:hypothetical protein
VISPTDTTVRRVVTAEQVSIGPVTADVLLPSVVPNTAFDRRGRIQGLIGQDLLASRRYTVDFKRRVLEWHHAPIRPEGLALPLVFEHGRFLVQARNSGRALRLVPDSGAGALVLFTSVAGPRSGLVDVGPVELSSSTSSVAARQVLVLELRVGSRIFRDVMAVALSGEDRLGTEGDGLLPLHLFDRVTFDGPGRLLILG